MLRAFCINSLRTLRETDIVIHCRLLGWLSYIFFIKIREYLKRITRITTLQINDATNFQRIDFLAIALTSLAVGFCYLIKERATSVVCEA